MQTRYSSVTCFHGYAQHEKINFHIQLNTSQDLIDLKATGVKRLDTENELY